MPFYCLFYLVPFSIVCSWKCKNTKIEGCIQTGLMFTPMYTDVYWCMQIPCNSCVCINQNMKLNKRNLSSFMRKLVHLYTFYQTSFLNGPDGQNQWEHVVSPANQEQGLFRRPKRRQGPHLRGCQVTSQWHSPWSTDDLPLQHINQTIKERTQPPPTLSLSIPQSCKNRDLQWINAQCFPNNGPLLH